MTLNEEIFTVDDGELFKVKEEENIKVNEENAKVNAVNEIKNIVNVTHDVTSPRNVFEFTIKSIQDKSKKIDELNSDLILKKINLKKDRDNIRREYIIYSGILRTVSWEFYYFGEKNVGDDTKINYIVLRPVNTFKNNNEEGYSEAFKKHDKNVQNMVCKLIRVLNANSGAIYSSWGETLNVPGYQLDERLAYSDPALGGVQLVGDDTSCRFNIYIDGSRGYEYIIEWLNKLNLKFIPNDNFKRAIANSLKNHNLLSNLKSVFLLNDDGQKDIIDYISEIFK